MSTQSEIHARQKLINSGFNAASTATEVLRGISLVGKTAIVTGGYSGLGKETVRVLRDAGAEVIVPTRDLERAEKELADIEAHIEFMDLLDPASIDAFVSKFLKSGKPLDLLINNAGIMARPFGMDARGYELQFATNHLGHFQLTTGLVPALQKAGDARVVSVSSWGHHLSPVLFDDPNFSKTPYDPWVSYGQSKTANILFALEFNERYQSFGIEAFSIHPGGILNTNLGKHLPLETFKAMEVMDAEGKAIIDPSRNLKTVEQGAATQVWCATSPKLKGLGGTYSENCDIAILEDAGPSHLGVGVRLEEHFGVLTYAVNLDSARRLWAMSEKMLAGK